MSVLRVSLLGPFQVTYGDSPVSGFRSDKVRALLAYLAVEQGHPHRRDALGGLLWPDQPPKSVNNNLRVSLARLRRTLGNGTEGMDVLLQPDNKSVQLNPQTNLTTDVAEFSHTIETCETHAHRYPERCPVCAGQLEQAVALYRGDFLDGFSLPDAFAFDDWLLVQREQLRRLALWALSRLGLFWEQRNDIPKALDFTRRQLALDPWSERSHRRLMRLLARNDEPHRALLAFRSLEEMLDAELGVEPEPETVALCNEIRRRRFPAQTEALRANRRRLPVQSTPFIGRVQAQAELVERLLDPQNRLVSLVGEGGVGKSRLALAVAEQVQDSFENGVGFVSLEGVDLKDPQTLTAGDAADILATAIAGALGIPLTADEVPADRVRRALRDQELLLVIDSFEHLPASAAEVQSLLRHCPQLAFLVTSRERLHLQAEYVFPVGGLATPDESQLEEAATFDSVQLFAERADRTLRGFAMESGVLPAVGEICRRVYGNSLGIELAAAQIERHTPQEIAQNIRRNLDFLTTPLLDVEPRHASMRAVFESSWQILSPQQQRQLARLSVFRGGFEAAAAQDVAHVQENQLAELVAKSLLSRSQRGRYALHDLLRQFTGEKLALLSTEDSTLSDVQAQHGRYFLSLVADQTEALNTALARVASEKIRREIDNVHRGWQWAVAEGAILLLLQVVPALAEFYYLAGLFQEGLAAFAQAGARLAAHPLPARDESRGLATPEEKQRTRLLAMLKAEEAYLAVTVSRYAACADAARQALQGAQAVDDGVTAAKALWVLGLLGWREGRLAEAEESFARGLETARQAGVPVLEAACLREQGILRDMQDDPHQALAFFEEALAIQQHHGHRQGEGTTLSNTGVIYERFGAFSQARAAFTEALKIGEEVGDLRSTGITHNNLGVIALRLGDFPTAAVHLDQALTVRQEIGDQIGEASTSANLCWLNYREGKLDAGRRYAQQTLQLITDIAQLSGRAVMLNFLGLIHLESGNLTQAQEAFEEALDPQQTQQLPFAAIQSKSGLARVALGRDNLRLAHAYCQQILPLPDAFALDRTGEPFQTYLTCYEVLSACADPQAGAILLAAHSALLEQADQLHDENERQAFLGNVPAHRQIIAHYRYNYNNGVEQSQA